LKASNDVGSLIRSWRELRACSQRELAERTGLSVRHLSFIETGRAAPSREAILWIAQALVVPRPDRRRWSTAPSSSACSTCSIPGRR
jgi:transcriptional regulator with XRE-family HTH domain